MNMMMIENYRAEVRKYYEMQRDMGRLSMNLTYPTVSRLRNECLMLFNEGCNEADLRILTSFLQRPAHVELQEAAIRRCDPDKFKALCNFMKRDIKTSEKNFELLAWLIDFQPRQFSKYLFEEKRKREISRKHFITKGNPAVSRISTGDTKPQDDLVLRDTPVSIPQITTDKTGFNFHRENTRSRNTQSRKMIFDEHHNDMSLPTSDTGLIPKNHQFVSEKSVHAEIPEKLESSCDVTPNQITLEYPSGVKLSLSTSDFDLISKLIRL